MLETLAIRDVVRLEFYDGCVLANFLVGGGDIDPMVEPQVLLGLADFSAINGQGSDQLALVVNEEAVRVVAVGHVLLPFL